MEADGENDPGDDAQMKDGDARPSARRAPDEVAPADRVAEPVAEPRGSSDRAHEETSDSAIGLASVTGAEGGSETSTPPLARRLRRLAIPAGIFVVCATVYALVAGPRALSPSPNNHFVHLAESLLAGQLDVIGGRPPGYNDWSCVDTELLGPCAGDAFQRPRGSQRWFVSFPPFPAFLLVPLVWLFGREFSDPLFWALFAGLAPAALFVLLRGLRERGVSERSLRDDLALVAVFAFGSVYFYTAVQGSVWFSAHVVASLLLVLFLHGAIGVRRPLLAGVALALCFWTRPTTALFAMFFLFEAMRGARAPSEASGADADASVWSRLSQWIAATRWREIAKPIAIFSGPILVVGGLAMAMNSARFHDPFEFGHAFLIIRWRGRIDKWGLFNFHYFAKNFAVFTAALPWLSGASPFVRISRHGLALWFTSPNLLTALWPKRMTPLMVGLAISAACVAVLDLCYQNSGWVQFGYRFSLDYMPALIVLLALGRRRFGVGFAVLLAFAIAVNLFGAITFDRAHEFYDGDNTQEVIFQPD